MGSNSSHADYVLKWHRLVANASANMQAGEFPEPMEPYRAALAEVLERVQALSNELMILRGVKQKAQKDLDAMKRKARHYSSQLVSLLIGRYGLDNPRLLDYGIKPRKLKLPPGSEIEDSEPETPPAPPVEMQAPETTKAPEAVEPSPAPEAKPAP